MVGRSGTGYRPKGSRVAIFPGPTTKLILVAFGKIGPRQPHCILRRGLAATGVSGFSFDTVDPLELFERLVLRAYGIFGWVPLPLGFTVPDSDRVASFVINVGPARSASAIF